MAKQQETKFDLVSDSGVFPFCRNHSHSDDTEISGDLECGSRTYYDDRPVLIDHYRVLERRRSNSRCSGKFLPSTKEYDDQNPSVDARLLEATHVQAQNNVVAFCSYSLEQGDTDSSDGSVSNSPVFLHPSKEALLWTPEPTHSYMYSLNPRELYSMVANCDTESVIVNTESHDGYDVAFKIFPCLDSKATQVTFCAEVTPHFNKCPNLGAIKVEAEIKDPAKNLNENASLMGNCVGDQRSICLSTLKGGFNIFLRNLMTHCRLFYSCRKCEHLNLHVRCWERSDNNCLNADSGVDIHPA